MRRVGLSALFAFWVTTGCVTHAPRTEVVVEIYAEPTVIADAESVHITVLAGARGGVLTSQADQVLGSAIDSIEWPIVVALVPAGGDPERVFVVEAEASDAVGGSLGIVRARSSYVAGRTLVLRLTLEECCRSVASTCATDQTCRSCACMSSDVDAPTLPDWRPLDSGAGRVDAPTPTDAIMPSDIGADANSNDGSVETDVGDADAGVSMPTEEATLAAADGAGGDHFGSSVALSADGSRALVGADGDQIAGLAVGTARVFRRTGMTWVEEATLAASGGEGGDGFGYAVALSADGTRALVGAHRDDTTAGTDAGSARVFLRTGSTWAEEATLVASGAAAGDEFGYAVAVNADGSRALVGVFLDDTGAGMDAGSARVFVRSGTTWVEETMLLAADGTTLDRFGWSVALSSDASRALVGADLDDTAGGTNAGSAHVYRRAGTTWTAETTLFASGGALDDYFGWSVALSGDGTRALVGAVLDDTPGAPDSGTARAFVRTGTSWVEEATLSDSSGARDGQFGTAVVLSPDGSRALVSSHLEDTAAGVDAGTARVFVRTGSSWVEEATLRDSAGAATDFFSYSLAMSADESIVLVAAFGDDSVAGIDAGSVHVFLLPTP